MPESRNTSNAKPERALKVDQTSAQSALIRARSASLSVLKSPRAREPYRMARSYGISGGSRARKSRTAFSVTGSIPFMIVILGVPSQNGQDLRAGLDPTQM